MYINYLGPHTLGVLGLCVNYLLHISGHSFDGHFFRPL